ncbi:hypothetical protein NC652_033808 [Populus alba x Populus x berolinensis]|uniref:Uncharacterized protein n=1 Tax=Populus alba x Populus x berolinensis TaxID=444605 RepID=A0AAD6LUD2_9ROSI|nr:hypothetical protein NC652_033808 [Populus alba x Populus x berolinensis]KAJ6973500.1 hypothetical protein NC653_033740 [Populus alba x Populus x berolinensis]
MVERRCVHLLLNCAHPKKFPRSVDESGLDLVGQPFACGKDAGLWGIQNLATEPCVDELNIIILINNDPDVFGRGVSPVQVKH